MTNNKKAVTHNSKRLVKKNYLLKVYGFINVFLSSVGSVHSNCWNITVKGGCICSYIPFISLNSNRYRKYDRVVSITSNWGNAVFHAIVECLVKIGYYIDELLMDESIIIHTSKSVNIKFLRFLGLNNSRIIFGNIFAKRLLVMEKGTCGSTPPLIHLFYLRSYIRKKIKSKPQFDIIIIKRYGKREILNHYQLHASIRKYYSDKKIAIFYPNTSFKQTLNFFKYAKMIVAPHGAGLSNIIMSDKCVVFEFLKKNLCYSSLAKNLGLKYYGIYEKLINAKFLVNISYLLELFNSIKL